MHTMLFSLEGNIGAGKSTLLKKLETTKFALEHVVLYEPVDEWLNVHPEGPNTPSLFEKYYSDKKRHGFMFQMYALQTRLEHITRAIAENPGKVIICERTHFTDSEIFAKMLMNDKVLDACEYYVYQSWSLHCKKLLDNVVKGVIYLRTSTPTCMTRIAQRNRNGEDSINVNYIKTLHDLHENWLINSNDPSLHVCCVDGNVHEAEVDTAAIVSFVNSFVLSPK